MYTQQKSFKVDATSGDKSPRSKTIRIRAQKSIKNDVSPINNRQMSKEFDEEEEELEVQILSKGAFDQEEELDFKVLMDAINKEKSPQKPVRGKNIRVAYIPGQKKQPKPEVNNQKADPMSVLSKLKDVKALIEEINKYQPKSANLNIADLKASSRMKVKRYKDCVFFGEIVGSKRNGKGVMVYADNRYYEGEWDNDLKHGRGFEVLPNGTRYDGQFVNGKPEGYGVFYWANGEIYEGQWKNGVRQGKGTWQSPKGECYDGEWNEGKADGVGVHSWKNGDRYEGDHRGFLKHGRGAETFGNGDSYRGNYINGKPDGYGEYKWSNGCLYKGHFKNGLRHGKGVWQKAGKDSDSYDGEWVNDKKCGPGTYRWTSGNYYRGEYFEDMRHGYGEMYWTDGSYYKGQWENGKENGEGELMLPKNKAPLKGRFWQNEFMGPIGGAVDGVEEDEGEEDETPSARRNVPKPPHTAGDVETFPDIKKSDGRKTPPEERSQSQAGKKTYLIPSSSSSVDKSVKKGDSAQTKKAPPGLNNLNPEVLDVKDLKAGDSKKITLPQKAV